MIRAVDAGGLTRFRPVLPTWKKSNTDLALSVGLLDRIRQHVVAAVCVDNDEAAGSLTFERVDDVGDDAVQRGRADAHRSRKSRVLVRASESQRGKLKSVVLSADRIGDGCCNQCVSDKGK